jgi:CubicO group peptidase (beta-lactamase class C family)
MRLLAALTAVVAMQLVPGPGTPGDLVLSQFGMYLEALRNQAGIPGLSAAIVGDQDIRWERGFGSQDLEQAVAASPDTLYHLDGLTQVMTASLVLRCAEEG